MFLTAGTYFQNFGQRTVPAAVLQQCHEQSSAGNAAQQIPKEIISNEIVHALENSNILLYQQIYNSYSKLINLN